MSFYRDVTRKPWNTVGLPEGIEPRPAFNMPNEKVALIIFATCASVLFSLLVVSYFIRMTVGDWVPLATPTMLWVNTGVLVLSSLCFHLAVLQSRKTGTVRRLAITGRRTAGGTVYRRAIQCFRATAGGRTWFACQRRQCLLLSTHRYSRSALAGRTVGVGQSTASAGPGCECGQGTAEPGALCLVLALPAGHLGDPVLFAGINLIARQSVHD